MPKKILIVDDEPLICEIFKDAFESLGFTVAEEKSGRDAFARLQKEFFDCVLSDVRMPGGDGVELAKNIQNMPGPKPKVFLVTGFSELEIQTAKKWGVVKIFEKPFDFRDVLEQVSAAIQGPSANSPG